MRRRMLQTGPESSEWDYELYNTDGIIPFLRIPVKQGQTVTVAYDKAGTIRGYIYDARNKCGTYLFAWQATEEVGEVSFVAEADGDVSFSGNYSTEQTYQEDIFKGAYLKIRVE